MSFPIVRTIQCDKCPWRKDVNPLDIPGGYEVEKHKALVSTIAEPGMIMPGMNRMHVMACHESPPGKEQACVGWLVNQLGPGNNLSLRLALLGRKGLKLKVHGDQHLKFQDTLPQGVDNSPARGI